MIPRSADLVCLQRMLASSFPLKFQVWGLSEFLFYTNATISARFYRSHSNTERHRGIVFKPSSPGSGKGVISKVGKSTLFLFKKWLSIKCSVILIFFFKINSLKELIIFSFILRFHFVRSGMYKGHDSCCFNGEKYFRHYASVLHLIFLINMYIFHIAVCPSSTLTVINFRRSLWRHISSGS